VARLGRDREPGSRRRRPLVAVDSHAEGPGPDLESLLLLGVDVIDLPEGEPARREVVVERQRRSCGVARGPSELDSLSRHRIVQNVSLSCHRGFPRGVTLRRESSKAFRREQFDGR
jgi:hypothetical protein